MRIQQNLPTPNGVQASGTGSLNLPLGATYYGIWLDISDGTTAMTAAEVEKRIKNIRLKVNGTQIRHYALASYLIGINQAHGIETRFGSADGDKSARLVMYFAEPQRRTPNGEDIFAWHMYPKCGVTSFTIEFDITSEATSAINVQVGREYIVLPDANIPTRMPNLVWHSSQTLPNDSAGSPMTSTLQRTAYTRIHAIGGAGCIDGAKVKVDGLTIREFRNLVEYKDYCFMHGLNVIANWLTVPFDESSRFSDILDLHAANSFEVEYATKTAGALTLLLEEYKGM